jgi:hypothetical protein
MNKYKIQNRSPKISHACVPLRVVTPLRSPSPYNCRTVNKGPVSVKYKYGYWNFIKAPREKNKFTSGDLSLLRRKNYECRSWERGFSTVISEYMFRICITVRLFLCTTYIGLLSVSFTRVSWDLGGGGGVRGGVEGGLALLQTNYMDNCSFA